MCLLMHGSILPVFLENMDLLLQVVAEVEAAVGSRLSNAPGRPEQLVVVLDCRGAPTLQAGPPPAAVAVASRPMATVMIGCSVVRLQTCRLQQ